MQMIRCDRLRHAEQILAILNDVIVHSTALYDYKPRTLEMMTAWFDAKSKGEFPVIGIESDSGDLMGFGTDGTFRARPAYKYSVEHSVYVDARFQGQGIGKRLLQELITTAKAQEDHVLPRGAQEDEEDEASYGARKVLCEQAAETMLLGRVLNVRAGVIVGPHDPTGRFAYWIRRADDGGDVVAPGNPSARLQLIDVRDLASWIVRMVEENRTGTFNATGSSSAVTFGLMLGRCNASAGNKANFVWLEEEFLLDEGIRPFVDLPFWIPSHQKDYSGFYAVDNSKAVESGLTLRPLAEAVRDTLLWDRHRDEAERLQESVGLDRRRELSILGAWRSRKAEI